MITDIEGLSKYLEEQVKLFTDIAVVGVSGGVDSSVVASICVAALGPENVELISMPYNETDQKTFNRRSQILADNLKANHSVVSIGESSLALEKALNNRFSEDLDLLTKANIRPRIRMSILYGVAGELGYKTGRRARVMGTGHLSEDIIGYDTKGGDALCDIFILSDLVKSEVYQLAEFYNVPEEIIKAPPSAGLYEGQTDQEELGYSYSELEAPSLALFKLLSEGIKKEDIKPSDPVFHNLDQEIVNFVITRYLTNAHKHEAPAIVNCRAKGWTTP